MIAHLAISDDNVDTGKAIGVSNIDGLVVNMSPDKIQDVIAYFSSHIHDQQLNHSLLHPHQLVILIVLH